jgi:hypothetical protein
MSWARIDDAFDDHAKVLALLEHEQGCAAVGLWTLCLTYAHRNTLRKGKTPGLIAASLPRRYVGPTGRELAALLVKEGLWEALDDGAGWMIHDFDQYLPTAKTSEARAAAGKKGAASRWAKKAADGSQSKGDGNLPSGQDNLPGVGHEADGKTMASDGSRAPARRAIPKGIAPVPVPVPVPPTAGADGAEPNPAPIVAAFIDGATGAGLKRPDAKITARVGKQAREMLAEGIYTADELTEAARNMGAGEWNDLAVQARKDNAKAKGRAGSGSRQSTTDDRTAATQALKAEIRRDGIAAPGQPSGTIQGRVER